MSQLHASIYEAAISKSGFASFFFASCPNELNAIRETAIARAVALPMDRNLFIDTSCRIVRPGPPRIKTDVTPPRRNEQDRGPKPDVSTGAPHANTLSATLPDSTALAPALPQCSRAPHRTAH